MLIITNIYILLNHQETREYKQGEVDTELTNWDTVSMLAGRKIDIGC